MADGRNLVQRIISACVFVPLIVVLVAVGGWALFLLVVGVVGRCAWEFYHLARAAGYRPAGRIGLLLALGLCVWVYAWGAGGLFQFLMVATLLCLAAVLRSGTENYASNALLTLGGVLYLGLLGSAPLLIVHQAGPEHGGDVGYLLAVIFLGIWLADSAAYLCGRRWGRIKLVPAISPCKTVVGLVAGLLGGLLPLSLYGFIAVLKPVELLGLLLLTGAGAQVGDLVESAIKRDLGVKDAPALIPGHGGALDRFDSYFFAFPLAYVYIELIGGF